MGFVSFANNKNVMKKLFLYVFLGLLLGSNAFAAAVEDFKCLFDSVKSNGTINVEKIIKLRINSTEDKTKKIVNIDNVENISAADYSDEKSLKKTKLRRYTSFYIWFSYEFNQYLPEKYSATRYILVEENKQFTLFALPIETKKYHLDEFSKIVNSIKENKNNKQKFLQLKIELLDKIEKHHISRRNSGVLFKYGNLYWNCNKQ